MIFIRHDDIELTPISVSPQGIIFIKYKDGLSDEEADAIKGELFKMGGFLNLSDELNKKALNIFLRILCLSFLYVSACL